MSGIPFIARFFTPTLAADQTTELSVDATGALRIVGTFGPASTVTALAEVPTLYNSADATGGTIKSSAGVLFSVWGYNAWTETRYFMLFNLVAVPGNGAVPVCTPVPVPPGTFFTQTFEPSMNFATGISWASSTTRATLTLTGVSELMSLSATRRT